MFGVGDFWLETQVIIKILTRLCYPRNFDYFQGDESIRIFFLKKKFQNGRLKKLSFSKLPILNIFHKNFSD
jgi:hypothetical protein